MSLSIVFAVLFSALLHATWNSLAHAISDRLVGFALIGVADAVDAAAVVRPEWCWSASRSDSGSGPSVRFAAPCLNEQV